MKKCIVCGVFAMAGYLAAVAGDLITNQWVTIRNHDLGLKQEASFLMADDVAVPVSVSVDPADMKAQWMIVESENPGQYLIQNRWAVENGRNQMNLWVDSEDGSSAKISFNKGSKAQWTFEAHTTAEGALYIQNASVKNNNNLWIDSADGKASIKKASGLKAGWKIAPVDAPAAASVIAEESNP